MPGENHLIVIQKPVTPHDLRVEEARSRLAEARERTNRALSVLGREVREQVDWRTWYRANPVAFLAAAFCFGFLLAKRR